MSQVNRDHSYNQELAGLHQLVMNMAMLCRGQLQEAVDTLIKQDVDTARQVIERYQQVNLFDTQANNDLVTIIARRQPIAADLRAILAAGETVNNLERVGDLAKRIAHLTCHLYAGDTPPPGDHLLKDIPRVGRHVDSMVAKAIESFDTRNPELAREVIKMGRALKSDFKVALHRLSSYLLDDAHSIGHVTEITLCLRSLERAGEHAGNIADHIVSLRPSTDLH
ncbi:MAG: phosphate signaling complex protein PhoU [Sedimenticola sp.]